MGRFDFNMCCGAELCVTGSVASRVHLVYLTLLSRLTLDVKVRRYYVGVMGVCRLCSYGSANGSASALMDDGPFFVHRFYVLRC